MFIGKISVNNQQNRLSLFRVMALSYKKSELALNAERRHVWLLKMHILIWTGAMAYPHCIVTCAVTESGIMDLQCNGSLFIQKWQILLVCWLTQIVAVWSSLNLIGRISWPSSISSHITWAPSELWPFIYTKQGKLSLSAG